MSSRPSLAVRIAFAAVLLVGAAAPGPFVQRVIDQFQDPWLKIVGDIDGDGFPDVVANTNGGGPLNWYRWPNWTKTQIAGGGYNTVDGELADINGDGRLDVVVGGAAWFENPGNGTPNWPKHTIGNHRAHNIVVADLDLDGKRDVVTRDQGGAGNVVNVWKQNGPDSWTQKSLPAPAGEGLELGDIDGDGDQDVVIGGIWYENTRNIAGGPWAQRTFASPWHADAAVKVGDLNQDGRVDVVLSSSEASYEVAWFQGPADPKAGGLWQKRVIKGGVDSAHGIELADLDGDGDLDVVTGEWRGALRVLVFENLGNGGTWNEQVLSTRGAHNVQVGDLGSDGDIDIVGAVPFGNIQLDWYENQHGPGTGSGPFKVLVFSKTAGFRHDSIPDGIAAIRALGAANNFTVDATENAASFTSANLGQYACVVFLSTTGDVLDNAQQAAFEGYLRSGKGFVGIHAASDTEYSWPWYGDLVGAYFRSHPAIQQATVRVEDPTHPSTAGLPANWVRTDEWYNFQRNVRTSGYNVLANLNEATYSGGDMGDHPIAWYRAYDGGRSWYTGGGHTTESYAEPLFRQHLLGGIRWAAGVTGGGGGGGGAGPTIPPGSGSGSILREWWSNVPGTRVSDIPLGSTPSGTESLTSFEAPTDWGDDYGQRLRGLLDVPMAGDYSFWIAGDDESELWLSTDEDPANRVRIARVPGWTNSREWTKYPEQKSSPITLAAGRYYVEALSKEGGGGDNLAVAWQLGTGPVDVIGGSYLSPPGSGGGTTPPPGGGGGTTPSPGGGGAASGGGGYPTCSCGTVGGPADPAGGALGALVLMAAALWPRRR